MSINKSMHVYKHSSLNSLLSLNTFVFLLRWKNSGSIPWSWMSHICCLWMTLARRQWRWPWLMPTTVQGRSCFSFKATLALFSTPVCIWMLSQNFISHLLYISSLSFCRGLQVYSLYVAWAVPEDKHHNRCPVPGQHQLWSQPHHSHQTVRHSTNQRDYSQAPNSLCCHRYYQSCQTILF